jgi:hypothetical protein
MNSRKLLHDQEAHAGAGAKWEPNEWVEDAEVNAHAEH